MRKPLLLIPILFSWTALAQETPVAVEDFFDTFADSTLTVEAPGVLANDTSDYAIEAELRSDVVDGVLTLQPDGSFTYTPAPGLVGMDSFTYVAVTDEIPEQFVVDGTMSGVKMTAELTTLFGTRTDVDSSGVSGTVTASVTPNTAPFAEIQIVALDLTLAGAISLTFDYGSLAGTLTAAADAETLVFSLPTAGPVADVTADAFDQLGNEVNLAGTLNISGTGIIGGQITQGPTGLDVTVPADLGGTIVQNGSELQLDFPLQAIGVFQVEGNDVGVTIDGVVSATAPLATLVSSEPALVTIMVNSTVGTESEALTDRFVLHRAFPNPAAGRTTITYDVPAAGDVSIGIYDVLGRRVSTLAQGTRSAGTHRIDVDLSDLPTGVYFYGLKAGSSIQTQKLVVLR